MYIFYCVEVQQNPSSEGFGMVLMRGDLPKFDLSSLATDAGMMHCCMVKINIPGDSSSDL